MSRSVGYVASLLAVTVTGVLGLGCDGIFSIEDIPYTGTVGDGGQHADGGSRDARSDGRPSDGLAPKTDAPSLSCGSGTSLCSNVCVEEQSDPGNCGACGNACATGLVCSHGTCAVSCASDLTECHAGSASGGEAGVGGTLDGGGAVACVDTQLDPLNCGTCNNACGGGKVCTSGSCSVSCPGGEVICGGACIDPSASNQFCGATSGCGTGDAGSAGSTCPSGQLCSAGKCGDTCLAGELACAGSCVDPLTSNQFCGASGSCTGTSAGAACAAGYVCAAGTCAVSCPTGEINCNGTCVNPQTSNQFCGASGNCNGSTAGMLCATGQVCAAGTCAVSCPNGELNCGGTCVNPQTSNQFCGASGGCSGSSVGSVCPAGDVCLSGSCSANCGSGNIACGGACVNPLTTNQYCGATGNCAGSNAGTRCGLQSACVNGSCDTLAVSCTGAAPAAPTFASVWPATTGWLGSNGKPISLTLNNPGVAATYECRTGPIATVDSLSFTECDGGDGTGLTYAPAPDVNGAHRTDVRVRTSMTCVSATTSWSFYVHSSLNSVAACAAPATDAQIFAKAAMYIPASGSTFGAGTALANPFVNIVLTGRTASVLSLRHTFTVNSSNGLISMRRAFVSTKSGTCSNYFRMGYESLGTRIYPSSCAAVVFNADGNGVCLSGSGGNLSFVGAFTNVNARLAGPESRASFFADRPFSQKSRTIQNDSHWLYLPE